MQRAFDRLDVVGMRDAHVELCLGIRGDDVLGVPTGDRADVHGDAALVIGERVHAYDLLGELLDGACALEEIRSRVSRPALDRDAESPSPLRAFRRPSAVGGRRRRGGHAVHGFAQWLARSAAACSSSAVMKTRSARRPLPASSIAASNRTRHAFMS